MGFQINTNVSAMSAYRNLSNTQNSLTSSLEKLSSGLRINKAADDAAGLSISEGLRAQIGGLNVASRNAQDGISVVQTAEGALGEAHSILQRVRDLAVQAGNDSNNAESRTAIQEEANALVSELDRISQNTNFNGTKLLDGSTSSLSFQVGANADSSSQIEVSLGTANLKSIANTLGGGDLSTTGSAFAIDDITALTTAAATFTTEKDGVTTEVVTGALSDTAGGAGFQSVEEYAGALRADANFSSNFSVTVTKDDNGAGVGIVVSALNGGTVSTTDAPAAGLADGGSTGTALTGGIQLNNAENAKASITMIDDQIKTISAARSSLGAVQNRFETAINSINISKENLSASESRIRDTDMAAEMANFTRSNILQQAGTSMLAQANSLPQSVLSLLG